MRVVLVDDQKLVRQGFRLILAVEPDITVVGEATNGAEGVDVVKETAPDVVLMDVQMPVMDGVAATAKIREFSDVKVVILTTFDRDDYLFDALEAGASGFLLKNAEADDLVDAVRAAAMGDLQSVTMVTRKPPKALKKVKFVAELGIDLDGLTEAKLLYRGTVAEAAAKFPANVNVAVALGFAGLGPEQQAATAKALARRLDAEGVAYDIASYRDAPPGLRLWAGATVERADLEALFPWLDWAYAAVTADVAASG